MERRKTVADIKPMKPAGEKIVIPVTFDSSGQNYAQPYTLQDPGPVPGFATGGYIRGPGLGVSDSIPALLSNGEYVIRAAAVRKLGYRIWTE